MLLPLIADMKCVAQSKNSELSQKDWEVLRKIQPIEAWTKKDSCSSANTALAKGNNFNNHYKDFLTTYIGVAKNNSLQIMQAHILRSSSALPLPFLIPQQPPYDLSETTNDLGYQTQNGLIITSRSKFAQRGIPGIESLEILATTPATFLNFFSHTIGWGGLFLTLIPLFLRKKDFPVRKLMCVLLGTHAFLLLWSPVNDARYLLTTNLLGWILVTASVVNKLFRQEPSIQNVNR
jgi:hypothetical protein